MTANTRKKKNLLGSNLYRGRRAVFDLTKTGGDLLTKSTKEKRATNLRHSRLSILGSRAEGCSTGTAAAATASGARRQVLGVEIAISAGHCGKSLASHT